MKTSNVEYVIDATNSIIVKQNQLLDMWLIEYPDAKERLKNLTIQILEECSSNANISIPTVYPRSYYAS